MTARFWGEEVGIDFFGEGWGGGFFKIWIKNKSSTHISNMINLLY